MSLKSMSYTLSPLFPTKIKQTFLNNSRSFFLLNTDHKIDTKVSSARILKALSEIIQYQTKYIKAHSIRQNTHSITDIIESTETLNIPGIALFFLLQRNSNSLK